MRGGIFYTILVIFIITQSGKSLAEDLWSRPLAKENITNTARKSVLVVEFGTKSPVGSRLSDAIAQGEKEVGRLQAIALEDELALEETLETKADSGLGMAILIHPSNMELLRKLLPLYPDIYFTLIDAPEPIYAMNTQNIHFKEDEGIFLLGAISAISSNTPITIMAMEDTPHNSSMAHIFAAGVRHIHPDAKLDIMLSMRPSTTQHTRLTTAISNAFHQGSDIVFSMDDEITEQGLRIARLERKMLVSNTPPPPDIDSSRMLTTLVKRYDLALMDVLRIYNHQQWHAGEIELGLAGGYVDYALNSNNIEIFPKNAIDQIEAIKDYTGQGIYPLNR